MEYLDFEKSVELMEALKKDTEDVCVFTDRGWGDDPTVETSYTIIKDGDGQQPVAYITYDTFSRLKREGLIGPNVLRTYKARTLHVYKRGE